MSAGASAAGSRARLTQTPLTPRIDHDCTAMSRRPLLLILPLLAAIGGTGCGPTNSESGDVFRISASPETVCRTCITARAVVVMGDTAGPGYIEETPYFAHASDGRFLVRQREGVKVYSARGEFLHSIGRLGQGPLEFTSYGPLLVDQHGHVHIFDPGNGRRTVVTTDGELLGEYRLDEGSPRSVAILDDDHIVANMSVTTPEGIGAPLHIVALDRSGILRSIGEPREAGVVSAFDLQRMVSVDSMGRIVSARMYEYLIEIWDEDGTLLGEVQGPTLNSALPLPGMWSPQNPPANMVFAIHVDGRNHLWLVTWIRRASWESHMVEEVASDGSIIYGPEDESLAAIYETQLDVFDLDARAHVARYTMDGLLVDFVNDSLAIEYFVTEEYHPSVRVWEIGLQTPP